MKDFLDSKLFEIGDYSLKLYNILIFGIFIVVVFFVTILLKRLIYKSRSLDVAKKFSVNKLSRYIIIIMSFLVSLNILGFDISVLLAGSAALLVGLGFGLQNLFSDFISGIILLLDGTLKVGDVIEVNSMICKVQEINFRTTTVFGREENSVILPNSELTGNKVVNWTHNALSSRFKVDVGVDYSTDVLELIPILENVANANTKVVELPKPFVRFESYGDSSLNFAIYFYTNDIFRVENIKSELRIEIFKTLKDHGIQIPFPQRVVHIAKD